MLDCLPAAGGSYALLLRIAQPICVKVGRLGAFDFPAGDYLYLGSAHGPGGLRARLHHHSRIAEHPHWHIDWLRPHAAVLGVWVSTAPGSLECDWAAAVVCLPGVVIPAPGFGAADCRKGCKAHLAVLPASIDREQTEALLRDTLSGIGESLAWHAFH
jgi:Uri superfamily endonuclease